MKKPDEASKAAAALLAWYRDRRRDLPWRSTRDPYRIWLSEVMLQQTRVTTVVPYFESFLERFPDIATLASASVDEVLASWSGLGYYRRARQMHAAARQVMATEGRLPSSARELERLPGFGPYTAAAVASIAFGEPVPAIDGNVERVLSRYLVLDGDPKRRPSRQIVRSKAAEMVDRSCPGESNQAMMELGATICTPQSPRCGACPLAPGCQGRLAGDPERYPPPRRRRRVEKIGWSVAVVERRGRVLFFRRPRSSAILPGTWELPNVPRAADPRHAERDLAAAYGGAWSLEGESFRVRHAVTYRSLTLHVHAARLTAAAAERETAWIAAADRGDFGVSSMFEKILRRWERESPLAS